MTQTTPDIEKVKAFLASYRVNKQAITMLHYEKEYFNREEDEAEFLMLPAGDEVLLRAAMFEVRKFIAGLGSGSCRLFLYYHYIRGESVANCAELLGIGRTSAFRLKRRALALAAERYAAEQRAADADASSSYAVSDCSRSA